MNTSSKFLGLLGLVSGILSSLIFNMGILIAPGLFFGAFLSYFLYKNDLRLSFIRYIFWTLGSTLAFFIALWTFIILGLSEYESSYKNTHSFLTNTINPFVIAGIIGGSSLLLVFHIVISRLSLPIFIYLTFLSALLSLASEVDPLLSYNLHSLLGFTIQYFVLFTVWQTGMAIALGTLLNRKKRSSKKK